LGQIRRAIEGSRRRSHTVILASPIEQNKNIPTSNLQITHPTDSFVIF
jgi:hypothetical protein